MNKKILITGGHLTPALAVLEELNRRGMNEIVWVGVKYNQTGNKNISPEYKIITSKKIKFYNAVAGKLSRTWSLSTLYPSIKNLFLILIGFVNASYIIIKEKPKIVVSFGGYVALPVVVVAKLFRIKVITHEQTVVVGLANKLIARFADIICISWEDSWKFFPKSKTILTGNPIRKEILNPPKVKNITHFEDKLPIIFITGGNQGAHFINSAVFEILDNLCSQYNIIHQTGNSTVTNDFQKALELQKKLNPKILKRYKVFDYLDSNQMSEALNFSNLIIARAGANTVTELALLGKKAILIPIPWVSNNEQFKNAKFLEKHGIALILEQNKNFSSKQLLKAINNHINSKEVKPINVPTDADKKICDEILKLIS